MIRRAESAILNEQNPEFDSSRDSLIDGAKTRTILARLSQMEKEAQTAEAKAGIAAARAILWMMDERGFASKEAIARVNGEYLAKLGFAPEELL